MFEAVLNGDSELTVTEDLRITKFDQNVRYSHMGKSI